MSKIIATIFLLNIFFMSHAQRIQLGFKASMAYTFFDKSISIYDDANYEVGSSPSFGMALPLVWQMNNHFSLHTGGGFQIKKYNFSQINFGFDQVEDGSGSFYSNMKIIAFEIPLVLSYKSSTENNFQLQYKAGCIFTFNVPWILTSGYYTPLYNGTDTFNYSYIFTTNFTPSFSPELYLGISLLKTKNNTLNHELCLSFQYSLKTMVQNTHQLELSNSTQTKNYVAVLEPKLSYLALSYSYFPIWSKKRKKQH